MRGTLTLSFGQIDVGLRTTPTSPSLDGSSHAATSGVNGHGSRGALDALSAASGRYTAARNPSDRPRRASGIRLALVAAVVVGGALTLVGRLDYRCAAMFQMTPVPGERVRAHYRKELLHFAWQQFSQEAHPDFVTVPWMVDSPQESQLRLTITAPDRVRGTHQIESLAQGFLSVVARLAQQARSTPTEGERVLESYGSELEHSLDEAQVQLDAALEKLPQDDPLKQRANIRAKWNELRSAFAEAKKRAAESSSDYERLRSEPPPEHGVVSSDMRRSALHADLTLQQDLKELAVAISEVKAYSLTVWRRTQSPVDKLTQSVRTFEEALQSVHAGSTGAETGSRLGPIRAALADYGEQLKTFRDEWSAHFADLRLLDVDPYTAGVLDRHQRIRRSLSDFLFSASRSLSQMRTAVSALNETSSDQARDHVLRSTLVRAFQRVQNAHHRFEFSASEVQSADHFRLDAALKSARGLRRRTQGRIAKIEKTLQAEAREQSRKRRIEETQTAKELAERVRAAADETIDSLINLQDELNKRADLSEEFRGAMLKVELAAGRLQLTQGYLNQTKSTLRDLRAKRLAPSNPTKIELVRCGVLGSAVDWGQRARTGGIAAMLTLLTVLLGQWWVSRR